MCGLSVASEFSDLSDVMTEEQISALSSVYTSVEDIDLFIAGLMEKHAPGGRLGPTFCCIIANQVRYHSGDKLGVRNNVSDEKIEEWRQIFLLS